MKIPYFSSALKRRAALAALAMAGSAAVLGSGVALVTAAPAHATQLREVIDALKLRLPKTPIDALDCKRFAPWCEVVSGDTLFYTDMSARYLFVGRLYDLEERRDITAARLLEVNPDMVAASAARKPVAGRATPAAEAAVESGRSPAPQRIDVSNLPRAGAVRWGNPLGARVVVFSDFQCGYCRLLSEELAKAGLLVEERPISILGAASRRLAEQVVCASDPVKALHAAYAGRPPRGSPRCKAAAALDANEAFAARHAISGTPVIVRPGDGAVLHGFVEAARLAAFAKGARLPALEQNQ